MDVRSSLFIIILQLLNLAKAEWNRNTALILVMKDSEETPKFPSKVRQPGGWSCRFYNDILHQVEETALTYCPPPNAVSNCNYLRSFAKLVDYTSRTRSPLTEICETPVVYSMEINPDSSENCQCKHDKKEGYRYRFVYLICDENSNVQHKVPIYEICYQDHRQLMQIIMGNYAVEHPKLLTNDLLSDERDREFDYNSLPDHNNGLEYVPYLYAQTREYLQRSVVPPEFLPFAHQRMPLYHFTNSAPMDSLLKEGWELFLRNLRNLMVSKVMGGLHGTIPLHENSEKIRVLGYFEGFEMVPVPKYFWVMIHNERFTQGIAIFMHNEPYQVVGGLPNVNVHDEDRCSVQICFDANLEPAMLIPTDYPFNFIYCCTTRVMTRKFGVNSFHNATLLRFPVLQT